MLNNFENMLHKAAGKKDFSMLDWGIHFGILMNLLVVAYLVYYAITH